MYFLGERLKGCRKWTSCESKSLLAKYISESSVIVIQASPFDYSHGFQTPVSIIPGGPIPRVICISNRLPGDVEAADLGDCTQNLLV